MAAFYFGSSPRGDVSLVWWAPGPRTCPRVLLPGRAAVHHDTNYPTRSALEEPMLIRNESSRMTCGTLRPTQYLLTFLGYHFGNGTASPEASMVICSTWKYGNVGGTAFRW